jgi:hypothetical protein
MRRAFTLALLACAAWPEAARAHDFKLTLVELRLSEGRFAADVACDLDALALGVDSSADSAVLAAEIQGLPAAEREALEVRLADVLKRRLRVRFDGQAAPFEVSLPDKDRPRPPEALPSTLGLVARLEGAVPAGAREVTFFASRAFPPVQIVIVRADGTREAADVLAQGAQSRAYPIAGRAAPEGFLAMVGRFLALGFTHILPKGLDHILFVLGLALLSPRLGPLVAQVTAFTLAHTLSLAASVFGAVSLSPRIVEPLIALSIVYVAVENLVTTRLLAARIALVFGFGLLHGLGFAGVLQELGWPEGRRLSALLSFNVGVELGQLAVIGMAVLLLAGAERLGASRRSLVKGLSALIAAAGAYWAVSRVLA